MKEEHNIIVINILKTLTPKPLSASTSLNESNNDFGAWKW